MVLDFSYLIKFEFILSIIRMYYTMKAVAQVDTITQHIDTGNAMPGKERIPWLFRPLQQ